MKLSELEVGKEYAVIPSWTYTSRGARDIATVRENDVVKATLIDKNRYEYEAGNRKLSQSDFRQADSSNRSIGVIFKAIDSNNREIYWTSRLADIIAPYEVLEPKWAQARTEQEKREEEERLRRLKAEEAQKKARAQVETSRNSVVASCKELLGASCEAVVDTNGYNENTRAIVTITLSEFERLIELAYEGKASVA